MTIYALSSGPGISGIAVIRISGRHTSAVVKQLIKKKLPNEREATLVKFFDTQSKDLIDAGVLLWFPKPACYTGDDLAGLQEGISKRKDKFIKSREHIRSNFRRNRNTKKTGLKNNEREIIRYI